MVKLRWELFSSPAQGGVWRFVVRMMGTHYTSMKCHKHRLLLSQTTLLHFRLSLSKWEFSVTCSDRPSRGQAKVRPQRMHPFRRTATVDKRLVYDYLGTAAPLSLKERSYYQRPARRGVTDSCLIRLIFTILTRRWGGIAFHERPRSFEIVMSVIYQFGQKSPRKSGTSGPRHEHREHRGNCQVRWAGMISVSSDEIAAGSSFCGARGGVTSVREG